MSAATQKDPIDIHAAVREFADVLRAAGLFIDGLPEMDDRLHRVPVDGDRIRERSGAYVGHLDAWPAGYVQNFRTGLRRNWKYSQGGLQLTAAEQRRLKIETQRKQRQREAERKRLHERTAQRLARMLAAGIWKAAPTDHPYLVAKGLVGIAPPLQDRFGNLVIPASDITGKVWSAQRIAPDGRKRFLRDGRVNRLFHVIACHQANREIQHLPLIIVEGWATGQTVARLTGAEVVVAFSSWNLEMVTRAFRKANSQRPIVIAGDDDHLKVGEIGPDGRPKRNAGREAAEAAARPVGGFVLLPSFASGEAGSDWNDRMGLYGEAVVKAELLAGLEASARSSESVD